MFWSQIVTGIIFSTTVHAADNQLVSRGLYELEDAQNQTQYLLQGNLSQADFERAKYIQSKLNLVNSYLRQSLNQGPNPPPPPPPGNAIELFHSDGCTGGLIARVNQVTQCGSLVSAPDTWAVRIGGQCFDTADMSSERACEIFKTTSGYGTKIYHSDSCSGGLIAIVDAGTNCSKLKGLADAWAIEVNGRCTDISDMAADVACERFR